MYLFGSVHHESHSLTERFDLTTIYRHHRKVGIYTTVQEEVILPEPRLVVVGLVTTVLASGNDLTNIPSYWYKWFNVVLNSKLRARLRADELKNTTSHN